MTMPMTTPAPPTPRLRILCLHGYHGTAATLRIQMASLVAGLEAEAEFVCVDAPSLSSGDHGWWHAVRGARSGERGDPGVDGESVRYKGWEKTRDRIVRLFRERGPFDGVFGFSQGAALAGLLVGLRSPTGTATDSHPLIFDFALMVGGFLSADPELQRIYQARESYQLPSLHMIGRADVIVDPNKSRQLAAQFENPTIVQHGGGHVIAATSETLRVVKQFLADRSAPNPSP